MGGRGKGYEDLPLNVTLPGTSQHQDMRVNFSRDITDDFSGWFVFGVVDDAEGHVRGFAVGFVDCAEEGCYSGFGLAWVG